LVDFAPWLDCFDAQNRSYSAQRLAGCHQGDYQLDLLYSNDVQKRLDQHAEEIAPQYAKQDPFPHAVIDDFLPPELLEPILEQFPKPGDLKWEEFADEQHRKLAFANAEELNPASRDFLHFMNTSIILRFLEQMTGIEGLIPDPWYVGGGLHQIVPGGELGVHADFNYSTRLKLDRRLNLLIYLNKDWEEEYGGHLELWDRDMKHCVKKVLPVFNRCVVFSTTSYSFHGHPEPLTCPEGASRKSIALYYYTNGRPEEEKEAAHSTLFKLRPGETLADGSTPEGLPPKYGTGLKGLVRAMTPPLILDALRAFRGK